MQGKCNYRRAADEAKFRQRCKSQLNGQMVCGCFPELDEPSAGRILPEVRECHDPDWQAYHDWSMHTTDDANVHQQTLAVVKRL
jgi:hypothetical protein